LPTSLISKINSFDHCEFPTHVQGTKQNGVITVLSWLFRNMLDSEREVLNLGCYTARDLSYLLPLCRSVNKPIECVDNFAPLNPIVREQLQGEIEAQWADTLVSFTWKDAMEAESLRSADYVYWSTPYNFPIHELMLSTNHPFVWATSSAPYLWPHIGQALANGQLHLLLTGVGHMSITNDSTIKDSIRANISQINQLLDKHNQYLEETGTVFAVRNNNQTSGMKWQWKYINALGNKHSTSKAV